MQRKFIDSDSVTLQQLKQAYERLEGFPVDKSHGFFHELVRFMDFVETDSHLGGICLTLRNSSRRIATEIDKLIGDAKTSDPPRFNYIGSTTRRDVIEGAKTTEELAIQGYAVLSKITKDNDQGLIYKIEDYILEELDHRQHRKYFQKTFLEPFYHHLCLNVEYEQSTITVLLRCKEILELKADYLLSQYRSNTQRGELVLSKEFQQVLLSMQRVEFAIAPTSPSGKIDIVGSINSKKNLLAEFKVFDGSKSRVAQWYSQIRDYLCNYSQSLGYLIIFNVCGDKELCFSFDDTADSGIKAFRRGGRTVYFLVVDIEQQETASVRIRKPIVIGEQDLIR